jgi:hypothetical protein
MKAERRRAYLQLCIRKQSMGEDGDWWVAAGLQLVDGMGRVSEWLGGKDQWEVDWLIGTNVSSTFYLLDAGVCG